MSIGSYTEGGISNVLVENCTFDGTGAVVRMKASRDRGGLVQNVIYRNLAIKGARYPVFISSYYPKEPKTPDQDVSYERNDSRPRWENILIENISVSDSQNSIILWGLPELPINGVTIRNATFVTQTGARVFHAKAVAFDNVSITPEKQPPLTLYRADVKGMSGMEFQ